MEEKKVNDDGLLWSFVCDGETKNLECASKKELILWALEWWAELCEDEEIENGEVREENIDVIGFRYDGDGERVVFVREDITLSYVEYHGDKKEHAPIVL